MFHATGNPVHRQIYQIFEYVAVFGLSDDDRCRRPAQSRVVRGSAPMYNRSP